MSADLTSRLEALLEDIARLTFVETNTVLFQRVHAPAVRDAIETLRQLSGESAIRTNSPTPRCDDFFGADDYRGAREFARELERENASLKMAVQEPVAWNHHCLVCQDPAGCAARRACDRNSDKLDKCDDGRSCVNATTGCWLREDGSGGCIKRLPPNDVLTYKQEKAMKRQRGHGSYDFILWTVLVAGLGVSGVGGMMIWWAARLLWK
jgi:hypothetical protein